MQSVEEVVVVPSSEGPGGYNRHVGMSLYNFPGNERRQVLFMTQALESD